MARKHVWLVVLLALLAVQCDRILPTKVGSILADPRKYADKEVTIRGEVVDIFSLVLVKYFVVSDGSGEIPVITKKPIPNKGSTITVKGWVREYSLANKNLIVIMESEDQSSK